MCRRNMNVQFINRCKHIIILNIDDGDPVFLQPLEVKSVLRNDSDIIKILVQHDCQSIKKSLSYYLVVQTEYHFSDVIDGSAFTITREKIQFSLNASYDRLFLWTSNANYLSETHKIVAEDKIKKAFNKSQRLEFIFDAIMASPSLIIILTLVGILLTSIWGWKIAIIFFPLAFLFVFLINWLADKFWKVLSRNAFSMDDEKTTFYKYFENDFISNYYSDINRTPFMGNVEIN